MASQRAKHKVREAKQALYRQLVLDAAERIFAEKGYEDAKMEEIAGAAGIALGTLYSVFSGKAELFRAIHEGADEELLERAVRSGRGLHDPLEIVLAGVRAYTEYFLEHPDLLRMQLREGLTWGAAGESPRGRERTRSWRAGKERLSAAFARCIEAGVFIDRDAEMLARMMIAMQQVQLAHWVEGGMRADPAEVLDRIALDVERFFRRAQ